MVYTEFARVLRVGTYVLFRGYCEKNTKWRKRTKHGKINQWANNILVSSLRIGPRCRKNSATTAPQIFLSEEVLQRVRHWWPGGVADHPALAGAVAVSLKIFLEAFGGEKYRALIKKFKKVKNCSFCERTPAHNIKCFLHLRPMSEPFFFITRGVNKKKFQIQIKQQTQIPFMSVLLWGLLKNVYTWAGSIEALAKRF